MPLGYGGLYSDPEIEQLYAKSRYYDPHTTRFTTKDSYRGSSSSTISQNRYIYCHQNPIKYADPAGFAPVEGDKAEPCTQTDQDKYLRQSDEELSPNSPNIGLGNVNKHTNTVVRRVKPTFGDLISACDTFLVHAHRGLGENTIEHKVTMKSFL